MNHEQNKKFLQKAEANFHKLFTAAKETDELHFVLSLSPEFRPYKINTALDAQRAFNDYIAFLTNNEKSPIHARIALALYSHLSEASGLWEVPKNLLGIVDGNKYSLMPFLDLVKRYGDAEGSIQPNANAVMRSLMKYAQKIGYNELAEVFKEAPAPSIIENLAQ